jgi:hypothetical protein
MTSLLQGTAIAASVLITLLVIQLIRKRLLSEEYSILWFLTSGVLLLLAIDRHFIDRLAALIGVAYPPSLLLLGSIFAGFVLSMHFSVALSRLSKENKRLAQEIALLRLELNRGSVKPAASERDEATPTLPAPPPATPPPQSDHR